MAIQQLRDPNRGQPIRYSVKGRQVRSENAAKPPKMASRWMLAWIRKLPKKTKALDLGCGKLRYTIPLSKRISCVTAVDSEIQLSRKQKIGARISSIREYASKYLPNVRVYATKMTAWQIRRYDVILCSNVLSAIPALKTRIGLLRAAHECLKENGLLLVTSQFRNSHFSAWKWDPNAEKFLDGYLVYSPKGASFYALLDAKSLSRLCTLARLEIVESGYADQTAYVFARRRKQGVKATG